jgi:hypothetical protein
VVSGDLTISGSLHSAGTNGGIGYDSGGGHYGGGSGGGAIMVLYGGSYSLTGSITVNGGSEGGSNAGNGGAGQSHVAQVST